MSEKTEELKLNKNSVSALSSRLKSEHKDLKTLMLSLNENQLSIDMIEVDSGSRKTGIGSSVVSEIVKYADRNQYEVVLVPALSDDRKGTTSRSRLVKFYKRFGFVENKGRNKDFRKKGGSMYRLPKSESGGELTGCQKYFDLSSADGFGIDKPLYYLFEKHQKVTLEFQSPDQYMKNISLGFGIDVDPMQAVDEDVVKKYAKLMKSGEKFPVGFYREGTQFQEGRHRALAAKELGCDEIPVVVIKKMTIEELDVLAAMYEGKTYEEMEQVFQEKGYKEITRLGYQTLLRYINHHLAERSFDKGGEVEKEDGKKYLQKATHFEKGKSYVVSNKHYALPSKNVTVIDDNPDVGEVVKVEYYSKMAGEAGEGGGWIVDLISKSQLYDIPTEDGKFYFEDGGEILSIDEKVEKYLKDKESNRKFTDTKGRVGGSAKEKRALSKILSYNEVSALDDEATEKEIVKRDRFIEKTKWESDKENGISSGASYFRNELRKSINPTIKKDNTKATRGIYAAFLTVLNDLLPEMKTVEDYEDLSKEYQGSYYAIEQVALSVEPNNYKVFKKSEAKIQKEIDDIEQLLTGEYREKIIEIILELDGLNSIDDLSLPNLSNLVEDKSLYSNNSIVFKLEHYYRENNDGEHLSESLPDFYNKINDFNNKIESLKEKEIQLDNSISESFYTTCPETIELYNKAPFYHSITETRNSRSSLIEASQIILKKVIGEKFYGLMTHSRTYFKRELEVWDNAWKYQGMNTSQVARFKDKLKKRLRYDSAKNNAAKSAKNLAGAKKPKTTAEFFAAAENNDLNAHYGFSGGEFHSERKVKHPNNRRTKKYWYWDDVKRWSEKNNSGKLIAAYQERLIAAFENNYKKNVSDIKSIEEQLQAIKESPEDWSWADKNAPSSTRKKSSVKYDITINSGKPLSRITRKGGLKVKDSWIKDDASVKEFLQKAIGLERLEYGVSLKDDERQAHVRHFSQSVLDLAEILNIDVKELIQLGFYHKSMSEQYKGLGLQLASAGRGKALATYHPNRTSINLTRSKGDGSVAHEMGHYLDNYLGRIASRSSNGDIVYTSVTGSEGEYMSKLINVKNQRGYKPWITIPKEWTLKQNKNILDRMKKIFEFIYLNKTSSNNDDLDRLLNDVNESTIAYEFRASDAKGEYRNVWGNVSERLQSGETIEDVIQTLFERYPTYEKSKNYSKSKTIIAQILKEGDIDSVVLNLKKNTDETDYYQYSKRQGAYWHKAVELFARAFEVYVYEKLKKEGRENNYLVDGHFGYNVYPQGKEKEILMLLFDDLIQAIRVELNLSEFKEPEGYEWVREDVDYEIEETTTPKKSTTSQNLAKKALKKLTKQIQDFKK